MANAFLRHLQARAFAPTTVRAYAFDLVNFARFLEEGAVTIAAVVPTDVFNWVDWQAVRKLGGDKVVPISARKGSAPASVNRRVAAVRAFFEYQVMSGTRDDNPVPAPRRGQACDRRRVARSGTSAQAGPAKADDSSASSGAFRSRSTRQTYRRSWPTSRPTGTAPSCS
jgi:site-specific recombinase XerC